MANYYSAAERDAIRRDNRAMEAAGVSMVDELEDIRLKMTEGAIGITASAADVDSLAKGGGHFTQDPDTTSGLTFGFHAGRFHNGKSMVTVSAGTVVLNASTTNYIEVDRSGTVSANASGFTAGRLPLWTVVTGASSITSVTISKPLLTLIGTAGVTGDMLSTDAATKAIEIAIGTVDATKSLRVRVPVAGRITAAGIIVGATVTADDTDYWTFGIVNKGAAGAGSTVIVNSATAANSTLATGGDDLDADVARPFALTGTAADLDVAAGDVLVVTLTKAGSAPDLVDATLYVHQSFAG